MVVIVFLEGGWFAGFVFVDDFLGSEGSVGCRIFYIVSDSVTSGGLVCAGCYLEGRDDGYVWY